MTRKLIKLINNERMNRNIVSTKACVGTAQDVCAVEDNATCTVGAIDLCVKDYAGCTRYAIDYCSGPDGDDFVACSGSGVRDI